MSVEPPAMPTYYNPIHINKVIIDFISMVELKAIKTCTWHVHASLWTKWIQTQFNLKLHTRCYMSLCVFDKNKVWGQTRGIGLKTALFVTDSLENWSEFHSVKNKTRVLLVIMSIWTLSRHSWHELMVFLTSGILISRAYTILYVNVSPAITQPMNHSSLRNRTSIDRRNVPAHNIH